MLHKYNFSLSIKVLSLVFETRFTLIENKGQETKESSIQCDCVKVVAKSNENQILERLYIASFNSDTNAQLHRDTRDTIYNDHIDAIARSHRFKHMTPSMQPLMLDDLKSTSR